MPTYDYECDACDHAWELFQKMTDDPVKKCPECGKKKARRLFGTGAAVMFKGSGFYETDYRSKSYQKSAAADKKAAEGDSKSESSKSESSKSETSKPATSKPEGSTNSSSKDAGSPKQGD